MYICTNCQTEYSKWMGQCTNCGQWNTIAENASYTKESKKGSRQRSISTESIKPIKISAIDPKSDGSKLIKTSIYEFDNTIGGGIVGGQAILLAGSPGVGKSTLSLEIIENLSKNNLNVLYICGEESPSQIKHRADRLKLALKNVSFYPEVNINAIEKYVGTHSKDINLIIVDSIQTLYTPDIVSTSGSVSQISESTNRLVSMAKGFNIPTLIIGHVTKSGEIAGPKILEHMVDTVLYFEGDRKYDLRILRVEKNRFGPTDEVGIFRMVNAGLEEIKDTKELFDIKKEKESGSVYAMALEGNRPVVVEVQALATKTYFSMPKRTTSGFELSRLNILLAILDKKLKLKTYEYDVYVNITGGINFKDPGMDLAILKAIISSIKNVPVERTAIFFGEVGLTGEIRKVFMEDKRIKEATRLGFSEVVSNKSIKNVKEFSN